MKSLIHNLSQEPPLVVALIVATALGAASVFLSGAGADFTRIPDDTALLALLLGCVALFQLVVILLPIGSVSFAPAPLLAIGFLFGPAVAMIPAVVAGLVRYYASNGKSHRAVFDCADFALATAVGSGLWWAFEGQSSALVLSLVAAAAGLAYWLVNVGLLSIAITLSIGATSPLQYIREQYAWMVPYMALNGLLALGSVELRDQGPLVATLPVVPALFLLLLASHLRERVTVQGDD